MSCYVKNPLKCFTKLWLWRMDSALSPGGDDNPDGECCGATASAETSPTGWTVGGDDVLVIVTFLLVVLSSLLLRGYLVSTTYNAVVPKVWKNAYPMSLGAGMALVGLAVLLIR